MFISDNVGFIEDELLDRKTVIFKNLLNTTIAYESVQTTYQYRCLATLVMLFFFCFISCHKVFIPFCKTHFQLSQFESQLIGSAFYVAYFAGSLVLFFLSNVFGYDILNRIGYKKGIIYGLLISVVGALLIIPSANANSFPALLGFLCGALGFSAQQNSCQLFP